MADGVLLLLMAAAAFLMGCQELFDGDVWWHLRAGQWILEHGRVPTLDPFTFASADRSWIDLHWLFEVILAGMFAAGGVRGMILMAAGAGVGVILVGLTARDRRWPIWVVAACWLPALVAMSARLVPRPEILSFLAMAAYLSVLLRTDDRPALAWVLPAVQVLWVNSHALFVLGPLVLCAYLLGHLVDVLAQVVPAGEESPRAHGRRWWGHMIGASAAVGLACLANPYGWRGALFPLDLFPKITHWGGPYKALIAEFVDLREYIQRRGLAAQGSLYTRVTCGLLLAVPLSFIVPAAWRAARAGRREGSSGARAAAWVCALGVAAGLILADVLGLPGPGHPRGVFPPGRMAPAGLAVLGLVGAALLVRSSRHSALMAAVGGMAGAAWATWLRTHLIGPEPGPMAPAWSLDPRVLTWVIALLGGAAAVTTLRAGGRGAGFRMLVGLAFGYLALQAVRNIGLFGLAAGFVLAWNLAEWASELAAEIPTARSLASSGLAARIGLAAAIGLVITTVLTGGFFRATAELRRLGLREEPLAYAHEAARFAGGRGLPDHALVFDLRQASVYLFHNGPARKLFIDGRLEIPTRSTFETYARLGQLLIEGRPGWQEPIRRMGDPLILLDHEEHYGAEATLLVNPDWRCIHFDAVGSIFVARRRRDLEALYPSVDFAARHFAARERTPRAGRSWPQRLGEAEGLYRAAWALPRGPGPDWLKRLAYLLSGGDRLREAIASDEAAAGAWLLLGNTSWSMLPDLTIDPSGPREPWDPATGLLPSQATYCYRRALERAPGDANVVLTLLRSFEARRMDDARDSTAAQSRHGRSADREGRDGLARSIEEWLARGRAETAARMFAEAEGRGISPSWATRDRVAVSLLHLGRPAEAGRIWRDAPAPPSPAMREARIATAALAALDFATAERAYQAALRLDPAQGDAWFGLALLHTQRGDAAEALTAARYGLQQSCTPAQASFLRGIVSLITRSLGSPPRAVGADRRHR